MVCCTCKLLWLCLHKWKQLSDDKSQHSRQAQQRVRTDAQKRTGNGWRQQGSTAMEVMPHRAQCPSSPSSAEASTQSKIWGRMQVRRSALPQAGGLASGRSLLQPWGPLWRRQTARNIWDPPEKVEQGHLYQQAGQAGKETCNQGMMGEGDCRPQLKRKQ